MKTFAAVGRFSTSRNVIPIMSKILEPLSEKQYIMNTGGASGADDMFAEVYSGVFDKTVNIFLPWNGYNGIFTNRNSSIIKNVFDSVPKRAFEIAESVDENWQNRTEATKGLYARNALIYLGSNLLSPVDFAIYFDDVPEYKDSGTQRGLRIAEKYNIPCFNVYDADSFDKVMSLIEKR